MHKLAFVTGATSGIGLALSYLLADKGISLILTGRNLERLDQLKEELSSKVAVEVLAADLTIPEDRKKIIAVIQTKTPDLIINNAGYGLYGDALNFETKVQLHILTVNASAVLEITLEAAKSLIEKHKKGTILNVASAAAFEIIPGLAVYAAAKSCVVQFSEALNYEMTPHGVSVLVSCPGMVDTDFRKRASSQSNPPKQKHSMTVDYAAERIWIQICKRKRIEIFNWKYKLGFFISKYLLPKRWLAQSLYYHIEKRIKPDQ